MLAEAIAWLLTPAPAIARRMGHLAESIAISARHRRCRHAWQSHLDASRRALLDSASRAESRRTALILGSGHLLDVPLAELAMEFDSVLLVDIVHPWSSRMRALRHTNVGLAEIDITGCLASLPDTPPPPDFFLDRADIDWVASVNLLSQLGQMPERWLRKHRHDLSEQEIADYGQALMRNHLAWLRRLRAPVCLLTDIEQHLCDHDGSAIETRDFQPLLGDWQREREWRWDLAPAGELAEGRFAWHRVAALTRQWQNEHQHDVGETEH